MSSTPAPNRRAAAARPPAFVQARTCYDHLAGHIGVALFEALVAREALRPPTGPDGRPPGAASGARGQREELRLGPAAADVFDSLGVDLGTVRRQRRRFATACLDLTERQPHLAGALGAALVASFVQLGWIARQPDTRAVVVTNAGRDGLAASLGIRLPS